MMNEHNKNKLSQLRELNFDLANYFSNTIIPQLFVDADLILRIFTPPAMKQFSLSHNDINRSIEDVKDNLCHPTIVENIREVIQSNEVLEKEVQTTDGTWFEMNIQPYTEHEEGRINGVIITFIDISFRFKALRELENLNARHEVLMFALSHDLRQPLSSMMLLLHGLKEAEKREDKEAFDKWMQSLEKTVHNMKELVSDFTSETEATSENSKKDPVLDLQEICNDVIESLRELAIKENVEIVKDFEPSEVGFPRNNLRSVIYNLVHNAVKFKDPGRDSYIKVTTRNVQDWAVLCVEDNGLGISAEHQRQVFKKSFRLNKEISGTGMGLFIIKRMIESHDGRIKMQSKPGEGTTFKVFFRKNYPAQKSS